MVSRRVCHVVNVIVSGLKYLQQHGSLLTNFSQSLTRNHLSRTKSTRGGPTRQVMDANNHSTISFAQQLLSHWLHILCSILRSTVSINYMLTHSQGLSLLLKQIGLNVECFAWWQSCVLRKNVTNRVKYSWQVSISVTSLDATPYFRR